MSRSGLGRRAYARRVADQPYLDEREEARALAAVRRSLEAERAGGYSPRWRRRLRAEARDAEALVVRSHLRLVVAVAHRYRGNPRVDIDDLVQEGNLALVRAVERFATHGRGRFAGYAYGPVRAAVGRAADLAGHPATVPERLLAQARQAERARRVLEEQGPVDRAQLRWIVGVPEARLLELERVNAAPVLLSAPIGDGTLTVGDTLYYRSEEQAVSVEAEGPSSAAALDRHIRGSGLTTQEATVVRQRFGLYTGVLRRWLNPDLAPTTPFGAIGARLAVSESQARVLYRRALAKLRRVPELEQLASDPTRHLHATAPDDVASHYLAATRELVSRR
ncbi:MAG TPA: sigma-70 family RNA polymerase sigma factor [Acidimicrobiales bacterium]|nr:sigma-70 family RNA polymerase sigma factor [Acidimicrobiales bacterium]